MQFKNQFLMDNFILTLADTNPSVCRALKTAFQDFKNVEVENVGFAEIKSYDCMVSAGNGFGLMDGGIDLAIIKYFGKELEQKIQQHIFRKYKGEQDVGTSFIIETGNPEHPYIAHTPTMRIPTVLTGTDNVYRATKAMLTAVLEHNESHEKPIHRVVCPGMGTGTGMLMPEEAARQMSLAYKNVLFPKRIVTWDEAAELDEQILNLDSTKHVRNLRQR